MWPDPADNEKNTKWVGLLRRDRAACRRRPATSTSWPATTRSRIKENYGVNYDRLVEVKRAWDPDNLFHLNQNIAP